MQVNRQKPVVGEGLILQVVLTPAEEAQLAEEIDAAQYEDGAPLLDRLGQHLRPAGTYFFAYQLETRGQVILAHATLDRIPPEAIRSTWNRTLGNVIVVAREWVE